MCVCTGMHVHVCTYVHTHVEAEDSLGVVLQAPAIMAF